MSKTLTDEQCGVIEDLIRSMMFHRHQNDNGPDYCCEFCGAEERGHVGIDHKSDCDGVKACKMLAVAE